VTGRELIPLDVIARIVTGAQFTLGDSFSIGESTVTTEELVQYAHVLSDQSNLTPASVFALTLVPTLLYHWALAALSGELPENHKRLASSIVKMFEACMMGDGNVFKEFMHGFFSLVWGSSRFRSLTDLFSCFAPRTIGPSLCSSTVTPPSARLLEAITISRKINGSIGSSIGAMYIPAESTSISQLNAIDFRSPCAIYFAGASAVDKVQPGFDILIFQPATQHNNNRPVMVLLECKWSEVTSSTELGAPALDDKVRLAVCQLAPFLPDMDKVFGSYYVRKGRVYADHALEPTHKAKATGKAQRRSGEKRVSYSLEHLPPSADRDHTFNIAADDIFFVACSWRKLTADLESRRNELAKKNIGVMTRAELSDLIGPQWRGTPLFKVSTPLTPHV